MVIVKLGNSVKMDGIDGHHTPFAQTSESSHNNVSAGREGNRAIKLRRRHVVFATHPRGAERFCQFAMFGAPGRNVNLAAPGLEHGNGNMRGRSKSIQTNA